MNMQRHMFDETVAGGELVRLACVLTNAADCGNTVMFAGYMRLRDIFEPITLLTGKVIGSFLRHSPPDKMMEKGGFGLDC